MSSPNQILESRIKSLNRSLDEIEVDTGISKRTMQRLFHDGASIKHEYLIELSDRYGINPNDILFPGKSFEVENASKMTQTEPIIYRGQPLDPDEFTLVDFYNVKASAGFGSLIEDKQPLPVAFRTYFIKNRLRTSGRQLMLIKIEGDSMEPTLHDDDAVLIDRSQSDLNHEGIYLLRLDDIYQVKRIQRIGAKKCRLISDNPLYPPVELPIDEPSMTILGRAVWTSTVL